MVQHKPLDQYLTSGKVSTRAIQHISTYRILKNLTKNFIINISIIKFVIWTSNHRWGVGMMQCKILDQYLTGGKVSTSYITCVRRYRLLKLLTKNLNIMFLRA